MENLKEYIYPKTIDETLKLLQDDSTEIIAGGTHLATREKTLIRRIVDITRLKLNYIEKRGERVHIGSTTTITEVIESPLTLEIGKGCLARACKLIGDTPLRNAITVGGNIARSYPWAGLPVVLLILDATIEIITANGSKRSISAVEYFEIGRVTSNELITEIIFPLRNNWVCKYEKFALTSVDFSWITLGLALEFTDDLISDARFAVSRIMKAQRLGNVETTLIGKTIEQLNEEEITKEMMKSLNIVQDFRSSKEYRLALAKALFYELLQKIKESHQCTI